MECHVCPQFKINLENASKGVLVEWASTPCATCQLEESSERTIDFDENRPEAEWKSVDPEDNTDLMMPCSALSTAMHVFLDLPQPAFELIRMRREGMTYAQIGEAMGVTAQAAEIRLKRLIAKLPVLGELFVAKVRRQRFRVKQRKGDAA